jgi:cytochrome c-type biogenesis protein CcmH/NrfG
LGLEVTDAQMRAATASVVKPANVPREVDPHTRLIDKLLPKVQHNPDDTQAVSMLAQIYFGAGDFSNAASGMRG